MFSLKRLLYIFTESHACIWVDVLLIKETPKAVLVVFDGKKIWFPKVWILRIKRSKNKTVLIADSAMRGEAISIKISEYHWAGKV